MNALAEAWLWIAAIYSVSFVAIVAYCTFGE